MTSLRLVPFLLLACACASTTRPDAGDGATDPPLDAGPDVGAVEDGDAPDADHPEGGPVVTPCDGVERLCGRLVFGAGVTGLRYESATTAGVTDASGGFAYRPGETVQFTIGGTTLGAAVGAPEVTLFDLVGTAPPVTEAAVRAELHDTLDVTAFDRVVNLATLLVSLDPGLDASDGIDLAGWDETLAEETIQLDAPLYAFQARSLARVARRFGVHRTAHLPTVFALLYASIEVVVPAHVLAREQVDGGDDGSVDHDRRFLLDEAGRVVATIDARADGVPFAAEHITYDASGRIGARRSEASMAGVLRTRTLVLDSHDALGRLVTSSTTVDTNLDGLVDETRVRAFVYDARGNPTLDAIDRDGAPSETTTMTYDVLGNLVRLEYVDARTAERRTSTRTYDDDRVLTEVLSIDRGESASRVGQVYTYVDGRPVSLVTETDLEDDGTFDRRDEDERVYDALGNLLTLVERRAVTEDGSVRTWTFDAEGRVTSQVLDHGVGRRLRDVNTVTFLDNGDRSGWQMEWLRDGIRRRLATGTITYQYAPDGHELERVQTVVNDGIAATTRITRSYVTIADGLVALVSAYAPTAAP